MGEKGAVVSKQQPSHEFLDGFRACEETPTVEETAVCSETDVDAVWQVLFVFVFFVCLFCFFLFSRSMILQKIENNVGVRTYSCLMPLEMGKLPDKDPLCFT